MSNNIASISNDLAEMLGISYEQALKLIKDFNLCVGDPLEGDLQRLARELESTSVEKEVDYAEPLWVKRQQNKHFKRGRN